MRKNPHVWLASYYGLGIDLRSRLYRILGYWVPGVVHSSDLFIAWAKVYEDRFGLLASQVPSAEMYLKHNTWVQELVPHENLLVYQPSMGWAPLCRFLDKEEPTGLTFPRVNEAAFLRRVKRIAMLIGLVVWVLLLSLVAWMLFMGSKYLEVAG